MRIVATTGKVEHFEMQNWFSSYPKYCEKTDMPVSV